MKLKDIKTRLDSVGIPIAYHHFNKPTQPPFLLYEEDGAESISSDAHNHGAFLDVSVRLVTVNKDLALERKIESAIDGLAYGRTSLWLDSEKIYETTYTFTISNKEEENA